MLIELTPIQKEIDRCVQISKETGWEDYKPQSSTEWIIEKGIYRASRDHNFYHKMFVETENLTYDQEFEVFAPTYHKSPYGVADTIDQIKEYYKEEIECKDNKYIIVITPVFQDKENKGKGGGWRWHKWGEYIGELDSKCEYLDDEEFGEDFKYVICFNINKI